MSKGPNKKLKPAKQCKSRSKTRHPIHDDFAEWMRDTAFAQNVSLAEIGRQTKIDRCAISALRYRWNPSLQVMSQIAAVLGHEIVIDFVPLKPKKSKTRK